MSTDGMSSPPPDDFGEAPRVPLGDRADALAASTIRPTRPPGAPARKRKPAKPAKKKPAKKGGKKRPAAKKRSTAKKGGAKKGGKRGGKKR